VLHCIVCIYSIVMFSRYLGALKDGVMFTLSPCIKVIEEDTRTYNNDTYIHVINTCGISK